MSVCRLVEDPPAAGAWNMAVDEALLEGACQRGPTLRLYMWSPATLSLGYFQRVADRQLHPASLDCPVVRRPSGGGAILHDMELTYALVVPLALCPGRNHVELYFRVHTALVRALAKLGCHAELVTAEAAAANLASACPDQCGPKGTCGPGEASRFSSAEKVPSRPFAESPAVSCGSGKEGEPFMCFARRSCGDVVVGTDKVAGSAQRRIAGAILQHGSILLGRSPYAPEFPGLAELLGRSVSAEEIGRLFVDELSRELALGFVPGQLEREELRLAQEILSVKYAHPRWTQRR